MTYAPNESLRARIARVRASRLANPAHCPACPMPGCSGGTIPTADGIGDCCTACAWTDAVCSCGLRKVFRPDVRGETVGGHQLVGWRQCPNPTCLGEVEICYLSQSADAVNWKLATGGRSLTAGGMKVRAEGGEADAVVALMARIVRVPELEAQVAQLQTLLAQRLLPRPKKRRGPR